MMNAQAKIAEYEKAGYSRATAVRMARRYFAALSQILGGK